MNYFDKKGHLNDESIALYVDALKLDKTGNLPEDLLQHIEGCTACHSQAIELYANVGVTDYKNIGVHPTLESPMIQVKPTNRNWVWMTLAALALVALVWVLIQNMTDKPAEELNNSNKIEQQDNLPETPIDPKKPDQKIEKDLKGNDLFKEDDNPEYNPKNEVPENEEPELFAANFVPFEELESQVGAVFRSDDVEISGPANDTRFNIGQTIKLEWKTEEEESLSVNILDNLNNPILNRENAKSPYIIGSLKPGLYYWKLETDDDLIHVGKFFVDRNE